jgi:seryl-tRNA synthetase
MLDLNFIRKNKDLIKKSCQNKQLDDSIVEDFLDLDSKRRELIGVVEDLKKQINQNAKKIKQAVLEKKPIDKTLVENGKKLKIELKEKEPKLKEISQKWHDLLLYFPNVPAQDVPIGKDESNNEIVKIVGKTPKFSFKAKSHQELMENLNLVDIKKAVKISGFRSYFLKNDGLLLEQALLNYSLRFMIDQGFECFSAPSLVNEEALIGTGYFPWGKDDHYYTQDKQILAGTSEVALTSYYANQTLTKKDLPIKMVGLSPCFRREVGTHGKDTKGLIRVHQFNKVEQVVYTVADEEETRKWHQKMVDFVEQILKNLKLPYQVLLMCTGDMGAGQRKKYDIETFFPGQNKYRETHSASYFNDFQARRLNIKYQDNGETKFVYTLNNTVAASPRLLAAIIENYQNEDGSISIPEVLQPFMNGQKIIKK